MINFILSSQTCTSICLALAVGIDANGLPLGIRQSTAVAILKKRLSENYLFILTYNKKYFSSIKRLKVIYLF